MNAIGPQNAVAEAVSIPVITSRLLRRRSVFMPRFSAYCSPRSSVLSGFMSNIDRLRPATVAVANNGIWRIDTPPKLPRPHTMYECTPSSVAKS